MKPDAIQFDPEKPLPLLDSTSHGAATLLLERLTRNGFPARIVSVERAGELRSEYEERRKSGELDDDIYAYGLADLGFDPPADFDARSIVIAAVPRPETAAVFEVDGVSKKLTIPPTYTHYYTVTRDWLEWLSQVLRPGGYRAVGTDLPLKLLATRSGLASYGRNNITYVDGLGSYFQLVSAWTDVPAEDGVWRAEQMLDRCVRCRACVQRCPTGAIRVDPFQLDARRCLVFHNERDPSIPFTEWIDADAHHTVVGCMECQWICPENKRVKGWVGETEHFSAEETALFLSGATLEKLADETAGKIRRLDATRFLNRMARNLPAAFRSSRRSLGAREAKDLQPSSANFDQ